MRTLAIVTVLIVLTPTALAAANTRWTLPVAGLVLLLAVLLAHVDRQA